MINYKDVFQLAQSKGYNGVFNMVVNFIEREKALLFELTLIQKWLRDEHKIFIQPIVRKNDDDIFFSGHVEKVVADEMRLVRHPRGESYEEALLNGINEALKLI